MFFSEDTSVSNLTSLIEMLLNRICRYVLLVSLPFVFLLIELYLSSCNREGYVDNGIVIDIDGNIYHSVHIGNQVWMLENLNVTHFRNGEVIPLATKWQNPDTAVYCNFNNTDSLSKTYGKLYNWYAAHDKRNIAPVGWHVPTESDWQTLIAFLGGENFAGGKLKEKGIRHWLKPNTGASNESGFTGLPGGYSTNTGVFLGMGTNAYWWSSTDGNETMGCCRCVSSTSQAIECIKGGKLCGFSVRCIKD